MIIKAGNCLHYLRSGASGWVRYDASTESVVVDNAPPFASSAPRGVAFGYVAKTVPIQTQVFDEATGACSIIVTQQVGSQVLDVRSDGKLLLGNTPLPGEIPLNESADAQNQTRLDYLETDVAEDQATVSSDIGMLVEVPFTRTSGTQIFISKMWMRMRKFRFRRSQWGQVLPANYEGSVQMIAVPATGGTADDPAYELRMSASAPSDATNRLPISPNNGDIAFYNGSSVVGNPNLPFDTWVNYPRGLSYFPLVSPVDIVVGRTTAGTVTITLPDYPAINAYGPKVIRFYSKAVIAVSTAFAATVGGRVIAASDYGTHYANMELRWNPTPDSKSMEITFVKSGSGSVSMDIAVLGYYL